MQGIAGTVRFAAVMGPTWRYLVNLSGDAADLTVAEAFYGERTMADSLQHQHLVWVPEKND